MAYGLEQQVKQKQTYKMSQFQLQAINYLALSTNDLRQEIINAVNSNPALEIVSDPYLTEPGRESFHDRQIKSDNYEKLLENQSSKGETLQQHLSEQLNYLNLSNDEYELCQSLIYNLDKNGCYGNMQDPKTLLNPARPQQTTKMLKKCISLVQQLDPVGTCCKTIEESLYIQAKIRGDADELSLYLLDGHLDFLSPLVIPTILEKLLKEQKKFGVFGIIQSIKLSEELIEKSIKYIQTLNPNPAGEFISDSSSFQRELPDIVLTVTKLPGFIAVDNFEAGQIAGNQDYHFQVKYASGVLPEIRISSSMQMDKENVQKGKLLINSLQFRKSTMVLQGCAIVSVQREFFLKGPGHIVPFTHRKLAQMLGIHESTVSRMAANKNSKYIQTEWGLFPASYFFSSAPKAGKTFSSEQIKHKIQKIIDDSPTKTYSDNQLCELLQKEGIKVARRTVTKYRASLGLKNSYER